MRKIIKNGKVFIEDAYVCTLEGTGTQIINWLEAWSQENDVGLDDFEYVQDYDCAYIQYWRDLTKDEEEKEKEKVRKTRERSRKLKEEKEARERKELLRLSKKYGTITE